MTENTYFAWKAEQERRALELSRQPKKSKPRKRRQPKTYGRNKR